MDYHHHARLTVHGRETLCRSVMEGRLSLCEAAASRRAQPTERGQVGTRVIARVGCRACATAVRGPSVCVSRRCPSRLHVWKLFVANAGRAYGSRKPLA